MAYQHFYSRVPARVSMFNRTDSFDTFACSTGITREFCEQELSNICEINLSAEDVEQIRKGQLSPVFAQFTAKDGSVVQSGLTFLPTDYSGERSAYFVHSLVFSAEEKANLIYSPYGKVFHTDWFAKDLSYFGITDPSARANPDYPDFEPEPQTEEPTPFPESLNEGGMLRRWIGTVLALVFGNVKNVFVILSKKDPIGANEFFCNLMNATMSVLPYHLREKVSFASHVNAQNQLNTFRVRGISLLPEQIKTPKTAVISFDQKTLKGVSDDEITKQLQVIDFLCYCSERDILRREFLTFVQTLVAGAPALEAPNYQTLSNLILLFKRGCGYDEFHVSTLNDEAMVELFTLYDKYRRAIPDEYRIRIVQTLKIFSGERREIPKKLFSKLTRMYNSEIYGTKRVILTVALDLIHTELMREKLFTFIESVVEGESPETQCDIVQHLCRVLYGGFLQNQILTLLNRVYPALDEDTKEEVLDKVLLVIRTKSVQEQVLTFIRTYFDGMKAEEKEQVINTIFEQLREEDELALSLIAFLDDWMERATEEDQAAIRTRLNRETDRISRQQLPPLVRMTRHMKGFVAQTVGARILRNHAGHAVFPGWVKSIFNLPYGPMKDNFLFCLDRIREYPPEAGKALRNALTVIDPAEITSSENLEEELKGYASMSRKDDEWTRELADLVLLPRILKAISYQLSRKPERVLLEKILEQSETLPGLAKAPEVQRAGLWMDLYRAADESAPETLFAVSAKLEEEQTDKKVLIMTLRSMLGDGTLKGECRLGASVLVSLLSAGTCQWNDAYSAQVSWYAEKSREPEPEGETGEGKKPAKVNKKAKEQQDLQFAQQSILDLINLGKTLAVAGTVSDERKALLTAPDSGLKEAVGAYLNRDAKKGKQYIQTALQGQEENPAPNAFAAAVLECLKENKKKGFLSGLFGKKK